MGNLSQANCTGTLKTPLGDDVLVLKSFGADEAVGELFAIHIEALSEQENIDFDRALGQACTVKLKTYQDKERFFCGILTQADWTGRDERYSDTEKYFAYRLVLRPWTWLLGHRADCRIFLDKKVTEIIQDVFTKADFSNGTDFKLPSGSYDKIAYCVQYRETDLAFVSRLMEQYGIYYYFEHKDGQHTMVLADSRSSHSAIPDLPTVEYNPAVGGYNRQQQNFSVGFRAGNFAPARSSSTTMTISSRRKICAQTRKPPRITPTPSSKFMIIQGNTTRRTKASSSPSSCLKRTRLSTTGAKPTATPLRCLPAAWSRSRNTRPWPKTRNIWWFAPAIGSGHSSTAASQTWAPWAIPDNMNSSPATGLSAACR